MKKRMTYRLLVQSEEKSRNILETALYALFALAAVVAIWQFADEPAMLTYHIWNVPAQQRLIVQNAS